MSSDPSDAPVVETEVADPTSQATQTAYPNAFTVVINHAYKFEWEEVDDSYVEQPGDVIGSNWRGKRAKRVHNTDSDWSRVSFHDNALQQIHDDRHIARQNAPLPKAPDLAIIAAHVADGVLANLTDASAITSFECAEYPAIATYLNLTYGVGA